jgi:hypothetical protein
MGVPVSSYIAIKLPNIVNVRAETLLFDSIIRKKKNNKRVSIQI